MKSEDHISIIAEGDTFTPHSALHTLHTPNFALRLDKHPEIRYNKLAIGVWRSLVSRLVRVQEASGSNPDTPTKNVGIAFAVPTFFIRVGIRKGGQHKVLVKTCRWHVF